MVWLSRERASSLTCNVKWLHDSRKVVLGNKFYWLYRDGTQSHYPHGEHAWLPKSMIIDISKCLLALISLCVPEWCWLLPFTCDASTNIHFRIPNINFHWQPYSARFIYCPCIFITYMSISLIDCNLKYPMSTASGRAILFCYPVMHLFALKNSEVNSPAFEFSGTSVQ